MVHKRTAGGDPLQRYDGAWPSPDAPGVYSVFCPATGARYVGGSKFVRDRCRQQFEYLRQGPARKAIARAMPDRAAGREMIASVLELCAEKDIPTVRRKWIDQLNPSYNATPISTRGLGNRSPESVARNAEIGRQRAAERSRAKAAMADLKKPKEDE